MAVRYPASFDVKSLREQVHATYTKVADDPTVIFIFTVILSIRASTLI